MRSEFVPWDSQPQEYVPASQAWLDRGMVALFDQRALVDAVSGTLATTNTASPRVSQLGVAQDYSGTANTQYPHRPAYATTGAFTIVTLLDVDAHTSYGAVIAKQGTTTTNAPYELRIGPASAGDSRVNLVRASAGSFAGQVVSASNLMPTLPAMSQVLIVTGTSASIGTSGAFWINGVGGTYTGAGGGNCTDNGAAVWIGRRYDGATQLDGRIYYVALFNRAISAAEAAEITAAPWRLFADQRVPIPTASVGGSPALSGGASSTVTVTAAGAGSAAESASGAASASVNVTAAGAGTAAEQASGGASASVTISAAGAGSIQASGGASASVVVTAAGAGTASTATSGGASAVVTVSAAGTGTATEAASGGASSAVSVTAAGAGTSSAGASGGSTATVSVSAVGAGTAFQPASGGAGAAVLVTAAGAGLALEIVAGGSSATVTVSAVGGGTDGSIVTGTEYIRLYSRITPAVAALSPICPTIARSSPVGVLRALRSNIDLESPT